MTFDQLDRLAREAGLKAANDNDAAEAQLEWTPRRQKVPRGVVVRLPGDGPTIEYRALANAAWQTSNRYSGQADNDNQAWPLAKVLRRDGQDYHLSLAERYRKIFDRAHAVVDLLGKDPADDIFELRRVELDESSGKLKDKGPKRIGGKHPEQESAPRQAAKANPELTKRAAKPVPRKWNGDAPLLDRLDASDELAALRRELGWLREPFEAAVVDGDRLEDVGRREGAGQGAGAVGRALVNLGFQAVDHYWHGTRKAA
jgi:hypothetical protein